MDKLFKNSLIKIEVQQDRAVLEQGSEKHLERIKKDIAEELTKLLDTRDDIHLDWSPNEDICTIRLELLVFSNKEFMTLRKEIETATRNRLIFGQDETTETDKR